MNWNKPLLSDSGGYQVFSLIHKNPKMGKITDDKVIFKSPVDGSKHELTPEKAIQIQFDLGVDMMVCLDDPSPNNYSKEKIKKAVVKKKKTRRPQTLSSCSLTTNPPFLSPSRPTLPSIHTQSTSTTLARRTTSATSASAPRSRSSRSGRSSRRCVVGFFCLRGVFFFFLERERR